MKALAEKKPLDEVLLADPAVASCISRKEMGDLLRVLTGTSGRR